METETHFEKSRLVVCCSAEKIFICYEEWILWIIQFCKCIWPLYIYTMRRSIFCIMMMINHDQTLKKRTLMKKCGKKRNHNLTSAWKYYQTKNEMIARLSAFCSCNWWHLQFYRNSTFYQRSSFIFGKSFCVSFSNRAATN